MGPKCYVCNPTNVALFTNDPILDSKMSNPCIIYKEDEQDATRIELNGTDYYYTDDPFKVYLYNSLLNGYSEVTDQNIISEIYTKK